MRWLACALLVGLAPACGGDDDPVITEQFDDPTDFSRVDCVPGSLAGLSPDGIWHAAVLLPERWFPTVFKIDGDQAYVNGGEATVDKTDDDLFVRLAYTDNLGDPRLLVLDACSVDPDGSVRGNVARCVEGNCEAGSFWGVHIERRPGEAVAAGLAKLGELNPGEYSLTLNVRVADGVAYLVRRADLSLIDVSDPAAPRALGASVDPTGANDFNDVKIVDGSDGERYALVGSASRGVVVIDVSDPRAPAEVTSFPPVGPDESINVHTLFTETRDGETRAYLANISTAGLDVWNIDDPRAPVFLGSYVYPGAGENGYWFVHDLYVEDRVVYLDYWGAGLVVVDAADPAAITLLGQYASYDWVANHSVWVTTAGGRKVAVMGDEAFYAHVRLVDVDPESATFMTEIGAYQTRPEVSVHNIMAFGDRAYVTYYQDGFRLLDLADPTAPRELAYYNSWDAATAAGTSFYDGAIGVDVDLEAGLIYLADTKRGLIILRESN